VTGDIVVAMNDDDRQTRYGHDAGSGANQPKRHERKEQDPEWVPRQGGDQTRGAEDEADPRVARTDDSDRA
jgi:hypothetical protein